MLFSLKESSVAQRDLKKVQRLARRLEKTRAELRDAMLAANEAGESVRDIASFAGMSSSRVQDWLVEARTVRPTDE